MGTHCGMKRPQIPWGTEWILHIPMIEAAGYYKLNIHETMSVFCNSQADEV